MAGGARAPAANQNEANNEAPPPDGEEEGEEGEENGNNAAQGNNWLETRLPKIRFLAGPDRFRLSWTVVYFKYKKRSAQSVNVKLVFSQIW